MTESQELTLEDLIEEFEMLGDWGEQCQYLIELGEQLPDLSSLKRSRPIACGLPLTRLVSARVSHRS